MVSQQKFAKRFGPVDPNPDPNPKPYKLSNPDPFELHQWYDLAIDI